MPELRLSMLSSGEESSYISTYTLNDDILEFDDKFQENAKFTIKLSSDQLNIARKGELSMNQTYILGKKTEGIMEHSLGLKMNVVVDTKELIVNNSDIFLKYEYNIEGEDLGEATLQIKFL